MASTMDALSPEAMLTFYRRLYPFKSVYGWLNHDHMPTRQWTHREFAFTLAGDVYVRYKSYNNADELKADVCKLNPSRFEIGPVYSARPRDKKTVRQLTPLQRELVFDIDMTDYDPIRTCCSEANICKKCWKWISAAVKVLDESVREHYGYEQLLWVYSGRRGIHLWISDPEALDLTDAQRKAVVGWMNVVVASGQNEGMKKVNLRAGTKALPPPLQAALDTLLPYFTSIVLEEQDCFGSEKGYEALLEFIPDVKVADSLRKTWSADPTKPSASKWLDLKAEVKAKDRSQRAPLMHAMEDIILHYTYPRIDAEVSKHRNHLLKAPFCIHPKTGRVCVPVDPRGIDSFDPERVPTIGQLLGELDEGMVVEGEESSPDSDVQRTSLAPYVEMMNKYATSLMDLKRKAKQDPDTLAW
ncbi:prim-pol domain-containing protein [Coprinellus micaceus]|uniref:DNA primase n=1 Tax=Coprinellus micaceus TaxID=71717 RepID=A0A4Y7TTK1_COPMI|nr:prim-pol domain-containing protein [Coprinellus micaceus]